MDFLRAERTNHQQNCPSRLNEFFRLRENYYMWRPMDEDQ